MAPSVGFGKAHHYLLRLGEFVACTRIMVQAGEFAWPTNLDVKKLPGHVAHAFLTV
jgi:hypothetical protein